MSKKPMLTQIVRILLRDPHARALVQREIMTRDGATDSDHLQNVPDDAIIRFFHQDPVYRERARTAYVHELARLGSYKAFARYYGINLSTAKFRGKELGVSPKDYNPEG